MKNYYFVILPCILLSLSANALDPGAQKTAPPPVAAPVAENPTRSKLVNELFTSSGLADTTAEIPDQIVASARSSAARRPLPPHLEEELEQIFQSAFPKDAFYRRTLEVLNANYDEARFRHLVEVINSPLSKRMLALEKAQAVTTGISLSSLPPTRSEIIRRLDSVSGTSALSVAITAASVNVFVKAAQGNCGRGGSSATAKFDGEAGRLIKENTLGQMAQLYARASDDELKGYIALHEDKDIRWFIQLVNDTILREVEAGFTRLGKAMYASIQKRRNPGAPVVSCPDIPSPVSTSTATAFPDGSPSPVRRGPRSGQDARECLNLENDAKIRACAEKFR